MSEKIHREDSLESQIHGAEDYQAFIYELDGQLMVFRGMSEDYIMKCPKCKIETRYIVQHITKSPSCQKYVDPDQFKVQFTIYKKDKILKDYVKWKQASMAK